MRQIKFNWIGFAGTKCCARRMAVVCLGTPEVYFCFFCGRVKTSDNSEVELIGAPEVEKVHQNVRPV